MMSALTFEMFTRPPGVSAGPTTITSLEITTGELFPMRPVGSSGTSRSSSLNKSTTPPAPKPRTGIPVRASSDTNWKPGVTRTMRASCPLVQYATPRWILRGAASNRAPSSGRQVQRISPVPASAATTLRRCPAVK
jgi:hypothetical protein